MQPGNAVGVRGCALSAVGVTAESVRVAVRAGDGLRNIGHNLHAARDRANGCTVAGGISGSSRTAKALGQLLNEGLCDIICGNVNGISNAIDCEAALA